MRLDSKLKALIQHNLNQFQATPLRHEGQKAAAVAIAVTHVGPGAHLKGLKEYAGWNTQAALILTRRAASLRQHSGQWALPGGRIAAAKTSSKAPVANTCFMCGDSRPEKNVQSYENRCQLGNGHATSSAS